MNKKECRKLAQQKYGPKSDVVNVSSLDRNQRYGIVIVTPRGAFNQPVLSCLGHGASYQAAWQHAQNNPAAQSYAKQWQQTKLEFEEFKKDPQSYYNKQQQQIEFLQSLGKSEQ